MHWTEKNTDNYIARIVFDLLEQLGVEPEDDFTPSLEELVVLCKSKGLKLSLIAYDAPSPVDSEIFRQCWKKCGKPLNYFDLKSIS